MKIKGLSTWFVHGLDHLTDRFPVIVPKLFQKACIGIVGNRIATSIIMRLYANALRRIGAVKKALVIVDVNIGDAVIMQSAVRALKECYPGAEIDYACNADGGALIAAMPEIHRVHNLFTQFMLASEKDLDALRIIIRRERYDVIFNLCPFLRKNQLHLKDVPFLQLFIPLGSQITHKWEHTGEKIHLSFMLDAVIHTLAEMAGIGAWDHTVRTGAGKTDVRGSTIYMTHEAVTESKVFLAERKLIGRRLLLIHSDAPFRYTQIPAKLQVGVIERVIQGGEDVTVLLSTGNALDGADRAILSRLPESLQRAVVVVPRMTIAGYAALIDACDAFITADTGTLHIAAARKVPLDERDTMRNRTAVIGVYGATSTRMSGYDAELPGHIPGLQSVSSKAFNAPAPCRNISCIAKPSKICATIRCFDGLTEDEIARHVLGVFRALPAIAQSNKLEKAATTR